MPLPFLPLLGAAARALGARGMAFLAGRGAASGAAGAAAGGGEGILASLLRSHLGGAFSKGGKSIDLSELSRRKGIANLSPQNIREEQQKLASKEFLESTRQASKALKTVALIGPAAYSSVKAVEAFSAVLLERRRGFAQFNTGIAAAFAKLERQGILLGVRTGAGISPSTQGLARAFMALREDIQPLTEVGIRIMNVIGTTVIQVARLALVFLRPAIWLVEKALDLIDLLPFVSVPTDESQAALQGDLRKFFREISRGNFGNPINQRPGRSQRFP